MKPIGQMTVSADQRGHSALEAAAAPAQPSSSRLARRMAGFVGLPLVSSMAPMLVLPVLARVAGVDAWGALGLGQAIGALASAFVICGWQLAGPAWVAPADAARQQALYAESLGGRLAVLVVAVPVVVAAAFVLAPGNEQLITVLMALAFALGGLSPAWFAIGRGTPSILARYEVLPRTTAVLLSVPLLIITQWLPLYPILVALGIVSGVVAFSVATLKNDLKRILDVGASVRSVYRLRAAAGAVVVAALYSTTPIAVMGAVLPSDELASFTSTDRLYRIGLYFIVAVGSGLQGWVAERLVAESSTRWRVSLLTHSTIGIAGFAALSLLGPTVSVVAFGESVAADAWACVWYGVAFLAVSITTSTGFHMLVPDGRQRAVLLSTVLGAVVGLPAMFVLGDLGPAGGAAGLATGELAVLAVQALTLVVLRRRRRRTGPLS